ncbi:hypothetical protein D3C80_1294450 [compost metagenome]
MEIVQSAANVLIVQPAATNPLVTVRHVGTVQSVATARIVQPVAISRLVLGLLVEIVQSAANVPIVLRVATNPLVIALHAVIVQKAVTVPHVQNVHLATSRVAASRAADVRMENPVSGNHAVNAPKAVRAASSMVKGLEANPAAKVLVRDRAASLQVAKG